MNVVEDQVLFLDNVVKHFPVKGGLLPRSRKWIRAVDGVSFTIPPQKTIGLVGESGCGKTTVANLILLLERLTEGRIVFQGRPIHEFSRSDLREYRRSVQAVFQDPYSSLNPRMRVGDIVAEPLDISGLCTKQQTRRRVSEMLERVGLPAANAALFPHEFSGGQRQRCAIARALILSPALVVLDEPVSALDISIRAQILNLLRELQRDLGLAYLLISHDLAAVEYVSHQIGVMYMGQLVEMGPANLVCSDPAHPYTKMLLAAALPLHPGSWRRTTILGEVPSPLDVPPGCRFHTRCPLARPECREISSAERRPLGFGHWVACPFVTKCAGPPAPGASTGTGGSTGRDIP